MHRSQGGQGLFLGLWTAKKTRYQADAEEDACRDTASSYRPSTCIFGTALTRGDARGAGTPRRGPAACVHRREEASPGVPGREDLSVCGGSGDGDANAVSGACPGERAVAAMERRVGIVEGYWTPHAARQGAMLTAHLVPREAEEVLAALGNMAPSKSLLDRLPKALSARWEDERPRVRGAGARGDAGRPGRRMHDGGVARRGDGADEGQRGGRVPRGELRVGVAV